MRALNYYGLGGIVLSAVLSFLEREMLWRGRGAKTGPVDFINTLLSSGLGWLIVALALAGLGTCLYASIKLRKYGFSFWTGTQ